jgi:hypothetical protein
VPYWTQTNLVGFFTAEDKFVRSRDSGLNLTHLLVILNVEIRSKGCYYMFPRINVEASMVPPISKYKILECSTCSEESIDYKFVIFG